MIDKKEKVSLILTALVFCAVLALSFATFQLGAYHTCARSDGVYVSDGHCVNYSSLNYCVGENDGLIKSYPQFNGLSGNDP